MTKFTFSLVAIGIASAAVEVPVSFEPDGDRFTAAAGLLTAHIRGDGAQLELGSPSEVVSVRLKGARASVGSGEQKQPGVAHYYRGADPSRWRIGVPQFGRVRFPGVYPGIDAVYYGNQRSLEYDFEVAPGADPSMIRVAFEGARAVKLEADGDLTVASPGREISQRKPVAYQTVHGRRVQIAARYRLRGNEASIELGRYDKRLPLVIDPQLVFSVAVDTPRKVVTDAAGAVYVMSEWASATKIRRFSPTGTLLYTTSVSSDTIRAQDLAVDGNAVVHFTGVTTSANYPLVNAFRTQFPAAAESFLTRLSPTGVITFSSFVTTVIPDNGPLVSQNVVAAASDGTSYVAGTFVTGTFTKVNAQTNTADSTVYVVKVAPNGTRSFATLLPAVPNANWLVSGTRITTVAGGVSVAASLNCPSVFAQGDTTYPACGGPFIHGTFVTGVGEQAGVSQIKFTKIYADSNETSGAVEAYPVAIAGSGADTFVLRGYGIYFNTITWKWTLSKLNSTGAETGTRNLYPDELNQPARGSLDFGPQSVAVSAAGEALVGGIDVVNGGYATYVRRYTADLSALVNSLYAAAPPNYTLFPYNAYAFADPSGALLVASKDAVDKIVARAGENGTQTILGKVTMISPKPGWSVLNPFRVEWNQMAGAQGYVVEVWNAIQATPGFFTPVSLVLTQNVTGGAVTSTNINLGGTGSHVVRVRACGASFDYVDCGVTSDPAGVNVSTSSSLITNPTHGSVVTQSTTTLRWQAMPGATSYSLRLFRNDVLFVSDSFPSSLLEAPYSLPSGDYRMYVNDAAVSFRVQLGAVPTAKPVISSANVAGTTLTAAFNTVAGADLYFVQVVQQGVGPGGGALSVAAKMVSATPAVLTVPQGAASVLVSACNADGCGPLSDPFPINVTSASPAAPVVGTPAAATVVDGSTVFFSWSRIPGDNGSNTTYRLYVQDMGRSRPALDVYTKDNFWAANLRSGSRYDVLVIANPGTGQTVGPANGFVVKGGQVNSPTPTQPGYQEVVRLGAATANQVFEWSPLDLQFFGYYEYLISSDGASPQTFTAQVTGTAVSLPVAAGRSYSGVVRMCNPSFYFGTGRPGPIVCGPWSTQGGTGAFQFSTVQ